VQLGLPTCGLWLPDKYAVIKLLTHQAPDFLGGWGLVGIIAASMSTGSGAILAMGTVMSHNVGRQFDYFFPGFITDKNLLRICRAATLPTAVISAVIAMLKSDRTGYLLIVAFDIVLATVVVPLLGCFYTKNPSPRAALVAILGGALTRIVLEFALPKDGYLILPFPGDFFLNVGPAASTLFPAFIDVPADEHWNPEDQPCDQDRYEDFTGVDSLIAPLVALMLYTTIQTLENVVMKKALFSFPGGVGYEKFVGDSTKHTTDADGTNIDASITAMKLDDKNDGTGKIESDEDQPEIVVTLDYNKNEDVSESA
jgi:hypothetical protein